MSFELDAYLARIGYGGPRDCSLATLQALHRLHPQTFAFEALNPFFDLPVSLEIEDLQEKFLRHARGGYCFEHNHLFRAALEALGFTVDRLGARVLWFTPEALSAPGGHMALRVAAEGRDYLCDVGFGNCTQTGPALLADGAVTQTPHEDLRVSVFDGDWKVEARIRGAWRALYRVSLHPQHDLDYAMQNFYLATHPNSHFKHQLLLARPCEEGRHALDNKRLAFHAKAGGTTKRVLESADDLADVMERLFLVKPPGDPAAAWARLPG